MAEKPRTPCTSRTPRTRKGSRVVVQQSGGARRDPHGAPGRGTHALPLALLSQPLQQGSLPLPLPLAVLVLGRGGRGGSLPSPTARPPIDLCHLCVRLRQTPHEALHGSAVAVGRRSAACGATGLLRLRRVQQRDQLPIVPPALAA